MMAGENFVGIDPGVSGGIAVVGAGEPHLLSLKTATERDVYEFLLDHDFAANAIIERPGGAPKGRQRSIVGLTKLHDSVGFLRGVLVCVCIPFDSVSPVKWQGEFGLKRTDKTESDTSKKNRHKQAAQRLFPSLKITHATADALLLAEYGRRVWNARNGRAEA